MANVVLSSGVPLRLLTGSALSTVADSIVDQNIYFGALTLASAGGAKAIALDGTYIDIDSIDSTVSGDDTGWTLSGGQLIKTTGTPGTTNLPVFQVTTTAGQINVTVTTDSDQYGRDLTSAYSYASDAERDALLDPSTGLGDVTLSGKTVLARDGSYSHVSNEWDSRNYTSLVTHGAHVRDGQAVISLSQRTFAAPKNIRIDGFKFLSTLTPGASSNTATMFTIGTSVDNLQFIHCQFATTVTDIGFVKVSRGINASGVALSSGGFYVQDCDFDGFTRNILTPADTNGYPIVIQRVNFTNWSTDGIIVNNGLDILIEDVRASNPWSNPDEARFVGSGAFSYMSKTSAWTNAADAKTATLFMMWRGIVGTPVVDEELYYQEDTTNGNVFKLIWRTSDEKLVFTADDDAATPVNAVTLTSTQTFPYDTENWYGILITLDTDGTHRMNTWRISSGAWTEEDTQAGGGETLSLTGDRIGIHTNPASAKSHWGEYRRVAFWAGVGADGSATAVRNYFVDPSDPSFKTTPATAVTALGTPDLDLYTLSHFTQGTNQGDGGAMTKNGTVELAHKDFIQGITGAATTAIIRRCFLFQKRSDGIAYSADAQFLFFEDTGGAANSNFIVEGCVAYTSRPQGIWIYNSQGGKYVGNTLLINFDDASSINSLAPYIIFQSNGSPGIVSNNTTGDNVCPPLGQVNALDANNYLWDKTDTEANIRADWAAIFDHDWTDSALDPDNIEELLTAIQIKASGALDTIPEIGANTAYQDYDNYVSDHPRLNTPTFTGPSDATGQSVSATATSSGFQVSAIVRGDGGTSANGALVSVSGPGSPQFRITSDSGGSSVVTDWTDTSAIVEAGEYLWLRHTTSPVGEATLQIDFSVGDTDDTWSSVTSTVGGDELALIDSMSNTNDAQDYTFTDRHLGGANTRSIFGIITFSHQSQTKLLDGFTADAVAGTEVAKAIESTQAKNLGIWKADLTGSNPSTGNITMSADALLSHGVIQLVAAKGFDHTTPTIVRASSHSSNVVTLDIDTVDNGMVLAAVFGTNNVTWTWAGADEQNDIAFDDAFPGDQYISVATAIIVTGETPRTLTATASGDPGTVRAVALAYPT